MEQSAHADDIAGNHPGCIGAEPGDYFSNVTGFGHVDVIGVRFDKAPNSIVHPSRIGHWGGTRHSL